LKTKQHQTTGPRNHREFHQAIIVAATLTLTLYVTAVIGSGCEARPQATASSQDHPAQLASQQSDLADDGSGNDRVTVEQHPATPAPPLPPVPEAAADRHPAPQLESNAAKRQPVETDPVPPVAIPLAATAQTTKRTGNRAGSESQSCVATAESPFAA
jgi:hypothetical protein